MFYLQGPLTLPFPTPSIRQSLSLASHHTVAEAKTFCLIYLQASPTPAHFPLASHQLIQILWPMKITHQLIITYYFFAAISLTMAVSYQKALATLATAQIQILLSYSSIFLNFLLSSFTLLIS